MEKFNDARINRLYNSLKLNNVNENDSKNIMKNGDIIKSGTPSKEKQKWFMFAMEKMDEVITDNEFKFKIRQDCACHLGGKRHDLCLKINKEYSSDEERIDIVNKTHYVFGHEIKIISKGKYQVIFWDPNSEYFKCACFGKNVNHEEIKMSMTYCYCCGGHVKYHLETLLGEILKVKCKSSSLTSEEKRYCIFVLEEIKQ